MFKNWLNKSVVAVLAGLFALSTLAAADAIKLTGVGGNNEAGVYTVPYYLSINGAPSVSVMCDDFTHDVVVNETWQGHILTYADLTTMLSSTRAGASVANGGLGLDLATAQQDYKELFWLFSQFLANPAPNGNTTADHINFAAWGIFDHALVGNLGAGWTGTGTDAAHYANSSQYWYDQAQANFANVTTTGFYIVSPSDLLDGTGTNPQQNSSPQEYIGYNPVPEPASLALLGSGLLGLGSFIRRKLI